MTTVKTAELIGPALVWAVAKSEQLSGNSGKIKICPPLQVSHLLVDTSVWLGGVECRYSTDWAQGGPIIERENMSLLPFDDKWEARCKSDIPRTVKFMERRGPTPLIAAMRCLVASKLGDEVEIPEELI